MESADRFERTKSQEQLIGGALTLLRDTQLNELSILLEDGDSSSISRGPTYEFRCDAPRAHTKADSLRAIRCALVVRVHPGLLGKDAQRRDTWRGSNARDVDDSVAIELAHGLMDPGNNFRIGAETLLYMVRMLCARLEATLSKADDHAALSQFEEWQVAELTRSLSRSMEQDLSIAFIAGRCRLSVCHFSRLFKATYGLPLHKFLVNERIKRAQARLVSTTEAIAQIALDSGFADQSSFTRRFTAISGVPPSVWRKQAAHSRTPNLDCSNPAMRSDCVSRQG